MRNQSDGNEDEGWEVLSDDWTEAEAEEVEDARGEESNDDDAIMIDKHDTVEANDTEEIECEVEKKEEETTFDEDDILSLDENHEDKEQVEEELTPGIRTLLDMGFSMKDSKEALFYSNGNMNQAISDLTGEDKDWHRMNRIKKDACIKLHETALIVGKAVEDGASLLCKAIQDQNVPAKAQVVAHRAKLTARSVGREIETFNHKYRFTDALATIGALFSAALLAKGKAKMATATAAVAGSVFVAGESMRSHRREEVYE